MKDIYLVCLIHSRNGSMMKADVEAIPGRDAVKARCPECLALGKSILKRGQKGADERLRVTLEAEGHTFVTPADGAMAACSRCRISLILLATGSREIGRPIKCGEAEEVVVDSKGCTVCGHPSHGGNACGKNVSSHPSDHRVCGCARSMELA